MREILIGAARSEITPEVGTPLSGFIARLGSSEAIADPLYVRALVAERDRERVGLIQADLLGFPDWLVRLTREFAWQELGIPRRALMLSATHTHSAPGLLPLRGCPMEPPDYALRVLETMRNTLAAAAKELAPGRIEVRAVPFEMGINRREETTHGVVLGVAPEKPRPRELQLARVRTARQEMFLFSHACHPYVLGAETRSISGDFPGQAGQALEQDGLLAFFLNGCAGDIAPRHAFAGFAAVREEGKRLAAAVRNAWDDIPANAASEGEIGGDHAFVQLAHDRLPSAPELSAIAERPERVVRPDEREALAVQARISAARQEWRRDLEEILQGRRVLEPVICEIQRLALGPLRLVGISGEPFFAIGERIRSMLAYEPWMLGTTNAYCGYIPSDEERAGGGYEVSDSWQYLGQWRLAPGAEGRVVGAARRLLETTI